MVLVLALTACGTAPPRPTFVTPSGGPSPTASTAATSPAPPRGPVVIPPGVTAGIAVFDRQTGSFVEQRNISMQFRSASLVKLLIALDYLWDRGPTYDMPTADRDRLTIMLRSSDDGAATYYWRGSGRGQIVLRMKDRLDLPDAGPPPASRPNAWGYTALSAGDLVRVYRYLLDEAPAPVRDFVLGKLRESTRCGTDDFDQSFGIPSAFDRPWAVKQGWSGFGDIPAKRCTGGYVRASFVEPGFARTAPDFVGEVLHTTGTVGADDRAIVAVLTVHKDGTSFAKATAALSTLVRSLPVPGATATETGTATTTAG